MTDLCATCRHWIAPSWQTDGFGACHLPSARRDAKLPPIIKPRPDNAWLVTHETFGCVFQQDKD